MPEKRDNKIVANATVTLPNSIEAEQRLLCCLLRNSNKQADMASMLVAEDFYQPNHQQIFDIMLNILKSNQVVNYTSVADALRRSGRLASVGDVEYLDMLTNLLPSHALWQQYMDIVKRDATMRRIIEICGDITKQAYSEANHEDVIANAEAALFRLAKDGTRGGLTSLAEVAAETLRDIQQRYLDPASIKGIATGYKRLDDLTNGLHGGELIVVAARPGIGKSTFAMNLAENVAKRGRSVAIFSLEMTNKQLVERLLSSMSGVPLEQIKSGNLAHRDVDLGRIHDAYAVMASTMSMYGNDTANVRPSEIVSQCRRLSKQDGLDLVIIDYIGLMHGDSTSRVENRQNEVASITKALKNMAKELDVPVIALSQLKREAESRNVGKKEAGETTEPVLSDLRESGAIEQDADIVMFIHRDTTNADTNKVNLLVRKHRNGATADIPLIWIASRVKFVDEYSLAGEARQVEPATAVERNVGDTLVMGDDIPSQFNMSDDVLEPVPVVDDAEEGNTDN